MDAVATATLAPKNGRFARIFAAYGPWEEPTRLVPYVMGCCLRGETPRVSAGTWRISRSPTTTLSSDRAP